MTNAALRGKPDVTGKMVGLAMVALALAGCSCPAIREVKVSSFGYDAEDATRFAQAALDSDADRVVFDRQSGPWIVTPLRGHSNQEIVFEQGVELRAKKGAFLGVNDCLLSFKCCSNVTVRGGLLVMNKPDYQKPPYKRSEWRHALNFLTCSNVLVEGVTERLSGGDGIYIGNAWGKNAGPCRNVTIRDTVLDGNNRQGVSVICVDGLLMERVTMSNTSGALPMAGIDFEPNTPGEVIRNVVMRDCHTKGNRGNGYELAFMSAIRTTPPMSLTFENCTSEGDSLGLYFNGGGYKEKGYVSGTVTLRNCTVTEPRGYPGIGVQVQRPVSTSFTFEGCRMVKDGVSETLDAAWLKAHYPLLVSGARIADRKVPSFSASSKVVDATPGAMRKLTALRLRNKIRYAFHADAARRVRFKGGVAHLKAWGKIPANPVIVRDAAGREVARCDLPPAERATELGFDVPKAGFYTMDVDPGHHGFTLYEADVPVAVDFALKQADAMSAVCKVRFHVPEKKGDFAVYVASGGAGENVGAKITDSNGKCVLDDPTVFGWQVYAGTADDKAGLWTLELKKPAKGRFEDYMIDLAGIPGALFLSESYWTTD